MLLKFEKLAADFYDFILYGLVLVLLACSYTITKEEYAKISGTKNCNAIDYKFDKVALDTNGPRALGAYSIKLFGLPEKIVKTQPIFQSVKDLYQFNDQKCRGLSISFFNTAIWFLAVELFLALYSYSVYFVRIILKNIIFDVFRINPYTPISSMLFRYIYPNYVFYANLGPTLLLFVGLEFIVANRL